MANISSIKLPNGTTYNIKDSISGYTTNTGTVTSVAVSGDTGISVSGSPITSNGTITISNSGVIGVKGNAESSYRTGNVSITADNVNAITKNLSGNTQNLRRPSVLQGTNDVTIDSKINTLRANRLAFLPADQIIIEKTTDGGTTWVDAEIADAVKVGLFSETRPSVTIPLLNGKKSPLCGLRFTITAMKYDVPAGTAETAKYNYWNKDYIKSAERYNQLKEMYFWVNVSGGYINVKVERATGADPTNWSVISNDTSFNMTGYTGNDYISFSQGAFGGGTTQVNNYWNYRITFMTDDHIPASPYDGYSQSILEIRGYGDTWWTKGNEYAANDKIYTHDYAMNVTFPNKVNAVGGTMTGPVTFDDSVVVKDGAIRLYSNATNYIDVKIRNNVPSNKAVIIPTPPQGEGTLALIGQSFDTLYVSDQDVTLNADTTNGTFSFLGGNNVMIDADDEANEVYFEATDAKVSTADVSSGTTYYPIVGANTTSATTKFYDSTGISYTGTNGTANASNGAAVLTLGNSTASSTGGWKKGKLSLYGSTTYATTLDPGAPTAARVLTLPDSTGTVALTGDIPSEQNIIDLIYPVGSIYMSINSTDPGTFFGGSWTRLKDTFLLAAGDTYPADDGTHTTATGGQSSVTLTAAQSGLKNHSHDITYSGSDMYFLTVAKSPDNAVTRSSIKAGTGTTHNNVLHSDNAITRLSSTASSGSDAASAHENMPPYLVVYMWKRTA